MATVDEIVAYSESLSASAQSQMVTVINSTWPAVTNPDYTPEPSYLNFAVETAQYNMSGVIPGYSTTNYSVSLFDRQANYDNFATGISNAEATAANSDPGAFNFPLWNAPTMPAAFTQSAGSLDIPAAPKFQMPDAPPTPTISNITLNLTAPGQPTSSIRSSQTGLPTLDQISFATSFDIPQPTFALTPPSTKFSYVEADYSDELLTAVKALLLGDIQQGGYGVNISDEQALWDRGRDRQAATYRDASGALARQFAGKGWPVPPMALAALQQDAQNTYLGAIGDINRELTLKRSDLYLQCRQFAVQQGISVEQALMNYASSKWERAFNAAKFTADFSIEFFNANKDYAKLTYDIWQTISTVQTQWVDNALKQLDVFKAKLALSAAQDSRDETNIKIAGLANEAVDLINKIRESQIEQARVEIDIQKLGLELSGQLTQQYIAQFQANEAAFSAYKTCVDAQVATLEPIKINADIYKTEVEAAKVAGEVQRDIYMAAVAGNEQNLKRLQQNIALYLATLQNAIDQTKMLAESNPETLEEWKNFINQTHINNADGLANAELRIKEFQQRWKALVEHLHEWHNEYHENVQMTKEVADVAIRALESWMSSSNQMLVGLATS